MPKAKKAAKPAAAKPKVAQKGLSPLEKARKAQRDARNSLIQDRVDRVVESLRIDGEIKRQLQYIQKQVSRKREPADVALLTKRRDELLQDAERSVIG